jgi:hypothetical protein
MFAEFMNNILIQRYIEGTATEQEISAVRDYLTGDANTERCYEIIFEMRKCAMEKLGIENDFLIELLKENANGEEKKNNFKKTILNQ